MMDTRLFPYMVHHSQNVKHVGTLFCIIVLCHLSRGYDLFLICKEHLFNMHDLLTVMTAQSTSNILFENEV